MQEPIKCRAQVAPACQHGKQLPAGLDPWSEDGTFDGETIVCDPCYISLGTPLNEHLEAVIARARERRAP